jgi:hypothetical protein
MRRIITQIVSVCLCIQILTDEEQKIEKLAKYYEIEFAQESLKKRMLTKN